MKSDQLFFSYSRTDASSFAVKLANDLKANGFHVWLDVQNIPPGAEWDNAIQKALHQSNSMVVIMSKASMSSRNVLDEVSYALKQKKQVFPILKDDCDIPFRLDRIQYIDFRSNYKGGLKNLIKTIDESVDEVVLPPRVSWAKNVPVLVIGIMLLGLIALFFFKLFGGNDSTKEVIDTVQKSKPSSTVKYTDTIKKSKPLIQVKDTGTIKKSSPSRPVKEPGTVTRIVKKSEPQIDPNDRNRIDTQENSKKNQLLSDNVFFSTMEHKASFEIKNDKLILYILSINSFPSISFDVNQNKLLDPRFDRNYGITTEKVLCPTFLLENNSTTLCGGAPSEATLAIRDNNFTFTIPLKEITSSRSAVSVSLQFWFWREGYGHFFFPKGGGMRDFKNVYTINIEK